MLVLVCDVCAVCVGVVVRGWCGDVFGAGYGVSGGRCAGCCAVVIVFVLVRWLLVWVVWMRLL